LYPLFVVPGLEQRAEAKQLFTRHIIRIPKTSAYLLPILMIVPLQLPAYHIAVL